MGFLDEIAKLLSGGQEPEGGPLYQLTHGGYGPPVERPTGISGMKPLLEQTFAPHEQATFEDVRSSLGAIPMSHAPIGMALPGISPAKPQVRAPASPRRPMSGSSTARAFKSTGDAGTDASLQKMSLEGLKRVLNLTRHDSIGKDQLIAEIARRESTE